MQCCPSQEKEFSNIIYTTLLQSTNLVANLTGLYQRKDYNISHRRKFLVKIAPEG